MEAMLLSSTPDQSISPYKINRNPRKNTHAFISRPSENFAPSSYILNAHGGCLIGPPPSLSSSMSSSFAVIYQQPPPPLLPLPISKPYSSLPTRNIKGLSTNPINRKTNSKTRGPDVTPKKPKSSTSSRKPDSTGHESRSETKFDALVTVSNNQLGPEPSDLPKKVCRVLKSKVSFASSVTEAAADDTASNGRVVLEELSCSIFSLAPPPSSLPLPKFSLKPKLGCNVEAGGIDAGATDNLRRLLRLR